MSLLNLPAQPAAVADAKTPPQRPRAATSQVVAAVGGVALLVALVGTAAYIGHRGVLGVPPGPRVVRVFHDASLQSTDFGRLRVALQGGKGHAYMVEKGHDCEVLDIDSKDKDGNPSPAVVPWKATIGSMPLPVLVIYEPKSRKLLDKQSLAKDATVDTVLAALKAKGG